jgi:hypothetical protein
MLTARVRRGPAVTDAVRTQHGPASLDYLLAKPVRAGSLPWESVIGAGRGRWGVVHGCPLGTARDRCEWQASGTAGEDTPVGPVSIRYQRERTVGSVLGGRDVVAEPR